MGSLSEFCAIFVRNTGVILNLGRIYELFCVKLPEFVSVSFLLHMTNVKQVS